MVLPQNTLKGLDFLPNNRSSIEGERLAVEYRLQNGQYLPLPETYNTSTLEAVQDTLSQPNVQPLRTPFTYLNWDKKINCFICESND